MKRPEDYTSEERRIMGVCEACRIYLIDEDFRRYHNAEPALTPLQRLVIYQKYQDMVVLNYPSERWEEVSQLFDRLFEAVEEYHQYDAVACS